MIDLSAGPATRLARLRTWVSRQPPIAGGRLLWTVSRPGSAALAALLLLRAALRAAFIISIGHLLGSVAELGASPAAAHAAWAGFIAVAVVWVLQQVAYPAQTLVTGWLARRCGEYTTDVVLDAALVPTGVAHLEDPATADRLGLAQGVSGGTYPPQTAVAPLAEVLATRLSALSSAILLGAVTWWTPVPLMVGWIVMGRYVGRQFQAQVTGMEQRVGAMRRASYLRELGTGVEAAKEVRMLGLSGWLADRFTESWRQGMSELFTRRPGAAAAMAARTALLILAYSTVFGWLSLQASRDVVSLTALTVAVQAAMGMAGFGWTGDASWRLAGAAASIRHLLALSRQATPLGRVPVLNQLPEAFIDSAGLAGLPRRGIRFEAVTFGYPGRDDRPAVNLDLWIPAGQSLAIVGENGAGKTTLIKLLAGLYTPSAGRILVDQHDLAAVDLAAWRRQLSVVFQDYIRYELSARDNVSFGHPGAAASTADLEAAVQQAGAEDVIAGLPSGWDTVLSRQFGDVDLSGGQWQRLALARALYAVRCGARVLVLDEPTAQLDARAESRLYARFLELTRGLTTVLISHRFNTVRLADRIAVLEGGRIVELGSHDQLMATGGRYARMFNSQAERLGV
jgi:ATP-binding cassette subfamily B protein